MNVCEINLLLRTKFPREFSSKPPRSSDNSAELCDVPRIFSCREGLGLVSSPRPPQQTRGGVLRLKPLEQEH